MKKLSLLLMSLLFILTVNIGDAAAAPDIRGEYSGSYTIVVSNCINLSSHGTYSADLVMNISTQTGNTFSGIATGTFNYYGITTVEHIQFSGTITESGQISGKTTHTFLGTGGEGTFTGQLSVNTLLIENPGHDTYGDTCTYVRSMSATRPPSALDAPTLSVSTSGVDVSLTWSSVSGATEYTLYYAPYPYIGEHTIVSVEMGSAMDCSATLWDGASYYVAITASNGFSESGYSNVELFIIQAP